jgi:hypothetical protein
MDIETGYQKYSHPWTNDFREPVNWVDICEHMPTLYTHALDCETIVECGVRFVVSSYAFARALKGRKGKLYMNDIEMSSNVSSFLESSRKEGIDSEFIPGSDLECPLIKTDMLFIDTMHVYGQLKRELNRWNSSVSKYIIMHDTEVDGIHGELLRGNVPYEHIEKTSQETGIPVHELTRGLLPAVDEFLAEHPEWTLRARYYNNNGLTILERNTSTS